MSLFFYYSLCLYHILLFLIRRCKITKIIPFRKIYFHAGTVAAQQRVALLRCRCDGAGWFGRILRVCIRFRRLAACAPFGVRRWGGFYRIKLVYTVSSCCGRPWAERSAAMARRRKAILRPRIRIHCIPSSSFKTSSALCPCTIFQ